MVLHPYYELFYVIGTHRYAMGCAPGLGIMFSGKALDLIHGCWSFWLFCCCFTLAPPTQVTSCSSLIESWNMKESVLVHCTATAEWKRQFAGAKKTSFIFRTWDLVGLPCFLLIHSLQVHFFPALCIMTLRKISGLVLSIVTGKLFQEISVSTITITPRQKKDVD